MESKLQKHFLKLIATVSSLFFAHGAVQAATLSVGAGKTYAKPSLAAAAAQKGDVIEIDPGTYSDDCAVWRADGLTIRGVGERPVMDAKGTAADEKAIWLIKGDNTTIENVELKGCAVKERDGSAIRLEGKNLNVRKCYIHDNEDGIYINDNPNSEINIEYSEFSHNGYGNGQSHNIYVNYVKSFKLRGCYVHSANAGDNVKSRAQENFILYNRISDDDNVQSGMSLNFPNGGACYVVGNVLYKGRKSGQPLFMAIGMDGATNIKQALYLINNTIVNSKKTATLFRVQGGTNLRLMDDIFVNVGSRIETSGAMELTQINHNVFAKPADFADAGAFDYHLGPKNDARHAGMSAGFADGIDLTPRFEYADPCSVKPRASGSRDIGAFEAQ
jgi:Right handed beta helix region